MTSPEKQAEIDANFDEFQRRLAGLLARHRGEYAVMREREVVALLPRIGDALRLAAERYPDGIFSIQEVTDEPLDLGFFSHVVH